MPRTITRSVLVFARQTQVLVIATVFAACFAAAVYGEGDWPRFRGPNGAGAGVAPGVAGEWSSTSYQWRAELGGVGHGSPVVAGGKVFVTTGEPATGESELIALSAATGAEQWRRRQPGGERHLHAANSYASTTPALDDERVYLTGATPAGVYCAAYSHAGEELWRRSLGQYVSSHGFASSPVVEGGLVYVADDDKEASSILALNAKTGDTVWQAERPSGNKSAYATPVLARSDDRPVLITQSKAAGIEGMDPATGQSLWRLPDVLPARCVSSPVVVAGSLVLGACGSGGGGKHLVAVRLNGTGASEAYRMQRGVPYVPTPVVLGDLLVLWHDGGTLSAAIAETGEPLWKKRIGGKFFASPVSLGGGVVVNVSTAGEAVVVQVDATGCEVIARNDLGEPTHASPAVADGRLYLRTESKLVCISGSRTAAGQAPAGVGPQQSGGGQLK